MKFYSTVHAARKLGLGLRTLDRYLSEGKVPAPKAVLVGNKPVRMWTEEDIEKVRKVLPSLKNGRKTRYQKERAKKKDLKKSKKGTMYRAPTEE